MEQEEPAPVLPEKNEWFEIGRTFLEMLLAMCIGVPLFVATLPWVLPFVADYGNSYYAETMAQGGHPLAANDEAAGAQMLMLWTDLAVCMGVGALIVMPLSRLIWPTKPSQPKRDIIRV